MTHQQTVQYCIISHSFLHFLPLLNFSQVIACRNVIFRSTGITASIDHAPQWKELNVLFSMLFFVSLPTRNSLFYFVLVCSCHGPFTPIPFYQWCSQCERVFIPSPKQVVKEYSIYFICRVIAWWSWLRFHVQKRSFQTLLPSSLSSFPPPSLSLLTSSSYSYKL
jgi:hypothetical protein